MGPYSMPACRQRSSRSRTRAIRRKHRTHDVRRRVPRLGLGHVPTLNSQSIATSEQLCCSEVGGDWLRQGNRYVHARRELAECSQTFAKSKCEQSSTCSRFAHSVG